MGSSGTGRAAGGGLIDTIRTGLAATGDPERAAEQQAYMKSAMPFLGVQKADVRRVVGGALASPSHRPPDRATWEATVRTLWDTATHREERYAALAVVRHRTSQPFRTGPDLTLHRHFIETSAWWDLVDETATHLVRHDLALDHAHVAAAMRGWSVDGDLWVRRAAIICQIGARDAVDLDLLTDVVLANLEGAPTAPPGGKQDFFIRKAIGWALREVAWRRPDWVADFVDRHRAAMAGLTVREATKHLARTGN